MGREVALWNYLRADLYRAVVSWRFLTGALGVTLTMYLASMEGIAGDTNVTYVVWLIVYGMPFMLSLVFSAFPFSGCFCEDFENKYAYLQIERGNLNLYTVSKIITIMLAAVLAMTAGVILYVSILHIWLPWFDAGDAVCQSAAALGGFRGVIGSGHYLLYFALFGLQYGILAGVLALLAAYVSPVSYTHLDVYKRQLFCCAGPAETAKLQPFVKEKESVTFPYKPLDAVTAPAAEEKKDVLFIRI